jgi:hypothetical protein
MEHHPLVPKRSEEGRQTHDRPNCGVLSVFLEKLWAEKLFTF